MQHHDDDGDRAYWRAVLLDAGSTRLPRWSREPVGGTAEQQVTVPAELAATLQRLADSTSTALRTVLLAAHAKVLAALTGEPEVTTGYVAEPGAAPLPCPLTVQPGSWRALLAAVRHAESELVAHDGGCIDDLRAELGLSGASYESVFVADDTRGDLAAGAVLRLGVVSRPDSLGLHLTYRTDVLDADCAARVAGYHLTALRLLAADPDARHDRQSLLSGDELDLQVDGLAGPRRELPDLRFHELFEARVAARPDAVAAVHGDRQWTYRELNARANRIGGSLLAHGLSREGVVAVVTERNLDWMACVLAVLKAGGAYLPVEPHFPADRIATTLSRAGCGLVLTEHGSTDTLDQALGSLPHVQRLLVDEAYDGGRAQPADENLGVTVTADQLAYIYFTSGSTGQPKGAMCEHAGMLNHLYAKVDDLGIVEGQVVAQTAPQCFDISLWQLVSALLVGGRTLVVEQDAILDVQRFVDTVVAGEVAVLQVVPSYLEVVLSYLEQHPRELVSLRCVSVTGEALKRELAQRWFATQPGIRLVNAYGLTETSDDTNHEVLDRAPDGDTVPLGRAVNNVRVYVVDEHLAPVPLGAPGLIAFAGVCVGRGYVNDPERTRLAYLSDPYHEGDRLYLGGDYGRWQPDGKLVFLGRRDSQVKIAGFRIEIGEVENTLLRVPGVRDGAVVVAERPDHSRQLVAFYTGPQPVAVDVLRERLGASLPAYMVPAGFHWQPTLPLTANGKIDTRALTALAADLDAVGPDHQEPRTAVERRLAAAWASVLGVEEQTVGRDDHFFDLGGSSLSAVKLVIALDRAVSLKDVTRHPVLADLAAVLDPADGPVEARPGLLQTLTDPDGTPTGHLVCFPYAGGNAVNFAPMATALRGSGLAVHALELPGHDLSSTAEPFAPVAQVAEQAVAEVVERGLTGIVLWGHSSGSALAVETARQLEQCGVDVDRVVIGAQLLGDADARRAAAADLAGRSAAESAQIVAGLVDGGLGRLEADRAELVGAAYRHDCLSAHRYLADVLESAPQVRLSAPLTVVVAADDPSTAGFEARHQDWSVLAEHVDLHVLRTGGHYFPRTRPAEAAEVVTRATELVATP